MKEEGIAAKNAEIANKEENPILDPLCSLCSLRPNSPEHISLLCDMIRQVAYDIHAYLGHGHLEKVYENALLHRLRKQGMKIEQQFPLLVYDQDGTVLGDYFADLFVEGVLVVELKAAKAIAPEHIAQLLSYLKTSHCEHGLLINFGSYRFEIRKFAFSQGGLPR